MVLDRWHGVCGSSFLCLDYLEFSHHRWHTEFCEKTARSDKPSAKTNEAANADHSHVGHRFSRFYGLDHAKLYLLYLRRLLEL